MRKVAVTGGLASGKTSVCRILESCGAYVVSADEIVHQLLSPNTRAGQQVIALLGTLDRKEIAKKVFSSSDQLRALERILHPAVQQEIEKRYQQVKNQKNYTLFVAEIPLLYESDTAHFYDTVIAIIADPAFCRERFGSVQEYDRRMKQQYPQETKAAAANFTIVNNGDLEQLKNNVLNLFSQELHFQ